MKRYIRPVTILTQATEKTMILAGSFNPSNLQGGGNLGNYDKDHQTQLGKEWADVFVAENEEGLPYFSVWED